MFPIQLQLDWKANAQFAGILMAHYLGWYTKCGIDLAIIPWQAYLNQVDVLKHNGNVIVSTEDNLLIRGHAAGQSVKAIAAMMQYSGIGWMALQSSGITQISDLIGKKVGIHGDGETAIRITLEHYGLSQQDVEIVEVGFDYPELLERGDYAAIQCLVAIEPLELAEAGFSLQVMPAYEWGYEVYSQVIATTDRLVTSEPNALKDFLKITFDGWRYAFVNPEEVANIVVSHYLSESTPNMQRKLIAALQPLFAGTVGMERLGWMDAVRWQKSIDYLKTYSLIDQLISAEDVMTNQFMEQIYSN